ncbi:Uncharacterized protein Adt_14099 [Abeliophyllum distichum]|uniref:Uncharacterized protein n=1 Tax=Abeliophyllum distichum TaxID=126358 RepID=A0ABD1TYQ1_9LAMI
MPIVEVPSRLNENGKTLVIPEDQSKTAVPPFSSKPLFTSWEQVKASFALRSSSTTRPSTSSIPSTNDMNACKKAVLAYTSFMDKDISRASVASQKKLLAHLNEDLADAFQHQTLALSADIRLTLRGINQELAAKKRNASQEIKRTRALMARYSEITVDDPNIVMEELSTFDTRQLSVWLKLCSQMRSILERLDVAEK